ncbi:hypothetical protein GDO81_023879 [Engystomops pustulosus]|uniref:Uncharacterized protein n=1 Tax=Engystomops pustulosus TaxID=76066 RepID=A0AAV6ZUM7_ENGPU|nr:hypothetical protein GDO81_023879 [Engystomops pustulosus]
MAYMFLKKEIICSLCSDVYTDPVMLHCGHNFCSDCIKSHISKDGRSGIFNCPECKQMSKTKAPLTLNIKLQSIAQNWKSVDNRLRLGEASCTYCLEYPRPAVKICLHCESSLCEKHLEVHSKGPEHSLTNVTSPPQSRVCSVHGDVLKFFCTEDKAVICMQCFIAGSHQGHAVQLLEAASGHRKEELQVMAEHMHTKLRALKERTNALQTVMAGNKAKAEKVKAEIRTVCSGLLTALQEVAAKMETEIKEQEFEVFRVIMDELVSLQDSEEQLSQKIQRVEDLSNQADPVLLLEATKGLTPHGKRQKTGHQVNHTYPQAEIDLLLISLRFTKNFEKFVSLIPTLLFAQCPHLKHKTSILLDFLIASDYLIVSTDCTVVRYTPYKRLPGIIEREQFTTSQVLSKTVFPYGKHYWEVKTDENGVKAVGVAYLSIEKCGREAFIGYNEKSWCLTWGHGYMEACHNSLSTHISCEGPTVTSMGVYLDYDRGQISFYRLCSPVTHLYTFTARFTEPLYAAFYVVDTWIKVNP